MSEGDNIHPKYRSFLEVLKMMITTNFRHYVIFRGDKIRYLRWLGARIGSGCRLLNKVEDFGSEPWLIELENRITLTSGVSLITHDGASRLFRGELVGSSKYGNRFGRILIHDNCFIGMNSIIMPDVEIGPDSIVGVGSVVNKDVPPSMVYAGVPAKPICTLEEYISRYQEKMIKINANTREDLRQELTYLFWGEER